jgi:hypothetical protein
VVSLALPCIVSDYGFPHKEFSNVTVIHAVLAQDFASHGHYTEPNTGITFYTSYETNGTITGDGEFSTVSWGGYLWGVAFPDTALTVDSYEYIGIIVRLKKNAVKTSSDHSVGWFTSQWDRMGGRGPWHEYWMHDVQPSPACSLADWSR